MLQQTQIATALPYFTRWMDRFPTVQSLGQASENDVLQCWQGLGYYGRCRTMLETARHIVASGFPESKEAWQALPGVGPYTSGAIASITLGQRCAAVDGNVERVFARLTACESSGGLMTRAAWKWAESVADFDRPGDWNQALMELGALICTPRQAKCAHCPVARSCVAKMSGRVSEFPRPKPKPPIEDLSQLVWVPYHEGRFGLRQIVEGRWWRGMWEFPREPSNEIGTIALRNSIGKCGLHHLGQLRHTVTHHRITLEAYVALTERRSPNLVWFPPQELSTLPMPAPQRRIFDLARRSLDVLLRGSS